jgi:3-methyladenine DNA glycosylase/8-oxoguanine DNA glycosylase
VLAYDPDAAVAHLRRAFQQAYRLPELPSPEEMRRIAKPWLMSSRS